MRNGPAGRKLPQKKSAMQHMYEDKMPPVAIQLEEMVIGSILYEAQCISIVAAILPTEAFYKDELRIIYSRMLEMYRDQKPIDILTMTHYLKTTGELDIVGGPYGITVLTNRVGTTENVEEHSRIILQQYIKREIIRVSGMLYTEGYDMGNDALDLLEKAQTQLYQLTHVTSKKSVVHISMAIEQAQAEQAIEKANPDEVTGIPTGYKSLDKVTSGWQKQNFVVIAARPGVGKTAFVMGSVSRTVKQTNKPVAIFSLEMSTIQLVNRIIADECSINLKTIRDRKLTPEQKELMNKTAKEIAKWPMFIDDTGGLSVFEFRAKLRRLIETQGVELAVIDYLQLMHGSNTGQYSTREQEVSDISRELKIICKDFDIPIIALSQLSRETEKRKIQRPILSDLRESGSIEQDADIVIFIYRPEYHGDIQDKKGRDLRGIAEFIFAKHRNGELETVDLHFEKQYTRFEDPRRPDDEYLPPTDTSMGDDDEF